MTVETELREFVKKLKEEKNIHIDGRVNNMFLFYAMEMYARSKCEEQRNKDMEYLEECEDHYAYANAYAIKKTPLVV